MQVTRSGTHSRSSSEDCAIAKLFTKFHFLPPDPIKDYCREIDDLREIYLKHGLWTRSPRDLKGSSINPCITNQHIPDSTWRVLFSPPPIWSIVIHQTPTMSGIYTEPRKSRMSGITFLSLRSWYPRRTQELSSYSSTWLSISEISQVLREAEEAEPKHVEYQKGITKASQHGGHQVFKEG